MNRNNRMFLIVGLVVTIAVAVVVGPALTAGCTSSGETETEASGAAGTRSERIPHPPAQ